MFCSHYFLACCSYLFSAVMADTLFDLQFIPFTPLQRLTAPWVSAWLTDMRLFNYASMHWAAISIHPAAVALVRQIAEGQSVMVRGVVIPLTVELVASNLRLPMDGVTRASRVMPAMDIEQEFGPKVKGEYKLLGMTNADDRDYHRWFLEAVWMQAKTYTISSRAKNCIYSASFRKVSWAAVVLD